MQLHLFQKYCKRKRGEEERERQTGWGEIGGDRERNRETGRGKGKRVNGRVMK
jgi:hypothetical protein